MAHRKLLLVTQHQCMSDDIGRDIKGMKITCEVIDRISSGLSKLRASRDDWEDSLGKPNPKIVQFASIYAMPTTFRLPRKKVLGWNEYRAISNACMYEIKVPVLYTGS